MTKKSVLFKLIHRFNALSIEIPIRFFVELKLIQKYTEKC